MIEIKFYVKTQYGRDDMYLVNCEEATAIAKVTGKLRNSSGEIGINHREMGGLEDLGFKFIQVPTPIKK